MIAQHLAKPEALSNALDKNLKAAESLCSSTTPKDLFALEKVLKNLQQCRKYFPDSEAKVCDAIFKIHDKAYYSPSDFMRHRIRVMMLQNFAKMPPKNMSVLKELLDRIALVEKLQDVFAMTQVITNHALEYYNVHQDKDLKVANRLKGLMLFLSQTPVVQNGRSNKEWLYDCATYLEEVQPACKGLVKSIQKPGPKPKISVPTVLEACRVYRPTRFNHISTHE